MPPWFDNFSLVNRGLIRELVCIRMLLISTSKDGCTLERVVAAHMPITLERMMGALHSNWQLAKLTPAHKDMATRRIQIFHAWVCVCGYLKLGGKAMQEREYGPNEGLMDKTREEREGRNAHLNSGHWMSLACIIHTSWPLIGPCGLYSTFL